MLLQGMPDLRKNDPKKYLDSLYVSFQHLIEKNLACLLCVVMIGCLKEMVFDVFRLTIVRSRLPLLSHNDYEKMFDPCLRFSFYTKIFLETWFDVTLVYRFNECNRRSYNS